MSDAFTPHPRLAADTVCFSRLAAQLVVPTNGRPLSRGLSCRRAETSSARSMHLLPGA